MPVSYTIAELADLLCVRWAGDPAHRIAAVASLEEAASSDASFLANPRYVEAMKESQAGVICISPSFPIAEGKNYLISEDPSRSFQQIAELFLSTHTRSAFSGIHPTAVIDPSASIGAQTTIGPYAVIDAGAVIKDRTRIDAHVFIGADVQIGFDCHIHPSCVIRERCRLGDRVILQSGAVIGSCGFGYIPDARGRHVKLQQLGIVILEDDVEIGANATIDRARFKATIVREGSKIDNLVQIAHNVEIGPHNCIAAQAGIAGSSKTGRHVMLGGQVGIAGHVELADLCLVSAQSGVSKSLKGGKYRGSPAIEMAIYNRREVYIRRLEEYSAKIRALEEKLSQLEKFLHKDPSP